MRGGTGSEVSSWSSSFNDSNLVTSSHFQDGADDSTQEITGVAYQVKTTINGAAEEKLVEWSESFDLNKLFAA